MRHLGAICCAVAGCEETLRADNRTGVCNTHKRMTGRCLNCKTRCDTRFQRCQRCALRERRRIAQGGKHPRPCGFEGCAVQTTAQWGFCTDHYLHAFRCTVPGCKGTVAAWSKSRCCNDHRTVARKLLQPS